MLYKEIVEGLNQVICNRLTIEQEEKFVYLLRKLQQVGISEFSKEYLYQVYMLENTSINHSNVKDISKTLIPFVVRIRITKLLKRYCRIVGTTSSRYKESVFIKNYKEQDIDDLKQVYGVGIEDLQEQHKGLSCKRTYFNNKVNNRNDGIISNGISNYHRTLNRTRLVNLFSLFSSLSFL